MRLPLTSDDTLEAAMDRMTRYNMTDCCTTQRPNTNWVWSESAKTGAGATQARPAPATPAQASQQSQHKTQTEQQLCDVTNRGSNLENGKYSVKVEIEVSSMALLAPHVGMLFAEKSWRLALSPPLCVTEMQSLTWRSSSSAPGRVSRLCCLSCDLTWSPESGYRYCQGCHTEMQRFSFIENWSDKGV